MNIMTGVSLKSYTHLRSYKQFPQFDTTPELSKHKMQSLLGMLFPFNWTFTICNNK